MNLLMGTFFGNSRNSSINIAMNRKYYGLYYSTITFYYNIWIGFGNLYCYKYLTTTSNTTVGIRICYSSFYGQRMLGMTFGFRIIKVRFNIINIH